MKNLKDGEKLNPKLLWKNFDSILGIPHPSKFETELAEFIYQFGLNLGLETIKDNIGNIIIRKPASSPEFADKKMVTIQSHIDMVPQKAEGLNHVFEKDPIKAFVDGNYVKADGTTLGSDNGIGVAAMMAVLESNDIDHGPIETFFTVDEETGMTGVEYLKNDTLNGSILVNLDSEEEGEICIGCAGGVDTEIKFDYEQEGLIDDTVAYTLTVEGMKGGHSGCNINEGRGNAVKLMSRYLWNVRDQFEFDISEINGGTLRNVIPSKCEVIIIIPKNEKDKLFESIKSFLAVVKEEYRFAEPDLNLSATETELPGSCIDRLLVDDIVNAIYACPNGVLRMDDNIAGLVETSSNLGVITTKQNVITILTLQRSSVNSCRDAAANSVQSIFELAGADEITQSGDYPGWIPDVSSPVLVTVKDTYKEIFGKEPIVMAIHAGLECALIGEKYPEMDMISFGPTILDAHSINERVEIESNEKFWDLLLGVLKNI
ncbi:MAG TPA: aminoacyl-histidine dipeptidase [Victivallales bacterium]|nr:aminoacyl-histidine dipeptidase [Victivallales bacterium]